MSSRGPTSGDLPSLDEVFGTLVEIAGFRVRRRVTLSVLPLAHGVIDEFASATHDRELGQARFGARARARDLSRSE